MISWDRFTTTVVLDTEYCSSPRRVVALVAQVQPRDRPSRIVRFFEDALSTMRTSPLPSGPDVLYVTFVGQAEWRSLRALGWGWPRDSVNLYAESRRLRNLALPRSVRQQLRIRGDGLIDTCRHWGIPAPDPLDKGQMRDLILSGGPWSGGDRRRILDYCQADVVMTAGLWSLLGSIIPPGQALYRGWFTQSIADMEDRGLPVDTGARNLLIENLGALRRGLILRFDGFGLCSESEAIAPEKLLALADRHRIAWPRTATGLPVMRLRTIRARLGRHEELHPVIQLAVGLNDLRGLRELPVNADGRARSSLWPFGASTGRNLPPGKEFLFALSRWTRGLIQPPPGRFLCYTDWTAQEFAIIAYLSGDGLLVRCYEGPGDPYINLGVAMGLLPRGTTKDHPDREVIKVVALGLFYGRGAHSIAAATRRPLGMVRSIVDDFWKCCPRAERWLESYQDGLMLTGRAWTRFGWTIHRHRLTKATSAANFPVQSSGVEMMRWASCLGFENGVPLCCPIHDAFVCEGRSEDENQVVSTLARCMEQASAIVLGGPVVRAKSVVFRHPDRFADGRGWRTWAGIMGAIDPTYAIPPARTA